MRPQPKAEGFTNSDNHAVTGRVLPTHQPSAPNEGPEQMSFICSFRRVSHPSPYGVLLCEPVPTNREGWVMGASQNWLPSGTVLTHTLHRVKALIMPCLGPEVCLEAIRLWR